MDSAEHLQILLTVRGQSITIADGDTSVSLDAVRGRTEGRMIGQGGTYTNFVTVDWLVIVADLGTFDKPAPGQVITCNGQAFTIGHPDGKTPAVQFLGQEDELTYRIHTLRG